MGTALSKSRTGKPEEKKLHDDVINPLKEIVATRIAKFRQDVESVEEAEGDKLVQVNKIVGKLGFFQVDVNEEGELEDGIINITSSLVGKGYIGKRLAKLSGQVIKDMLSSSVSVVCEERNYFATVDDIGGIYRLDVIYITYAFGSSGVQHNAGKKNVVAGYIIKSSSSIESIDPNTLRIIIADSYSETTGDNRFKLFGALAGVVLGQDEEAGKNSVKLEETWTSVTRDLENKRIASAGSTSLKETKTG